MSNELNLSERYARLIREDGGVFYVPKEAPTVSSWILAFFIMLIMAIPVNNLIVGGYTPGRAMGLVLAVIFGALAFYTNRNEKGHPTKVDTLGRTVQVFRRSPVSFDSILEVSLRKFNLGITNRYHYFYGAPEIFWIVNLNTGMNAIELFTAQQEAPARFVAQYLSQALGKPLKITGVDPEKA